MVFRGAYGARLDKEHVAGSLKSFEWCIFVFG